MKREDRIRAGQTTIRRYGAHAWAAQARAGHLAKALRAEGFDPEKMSPAALAAFQQQTNNRIAAHMRTARFAKRDARKASAAYRLAEAEAALRVAQAEAEAEAAQAQNGGGS